MEGVGVKALARHRYGGPEVLRVEEVERPALEADRALVRVRAASLNKVDLHTLHGRPLPTRGRALLRPRDRLLGTDFAGVVEAVGAELAGFAPGDEVIGARSGALAEYVCTKTIVRKPAGASFEEAATLPVAGLTALQGLRDHGRLRPGERVLVNGGSGGVGTLAIQIAKALGGHVTAVCSTRNLEQARQLGADEAVDYTREDVTRGGARFDLILDVAGGHSWRSLRRILSPHGRLVVVGAHGSRFLLPHIAALWLASRAGRRPAAFFITKLRLPDLEFLAELLADGRLTPRIDRTYELADAAEAMRAFAEGHVRGKLVVTI
ncbi:MAG TPA: NAD(P)-dependent alcohol dehydrogenase [Gaiellaceae bacterium]|nr:NAD(P)-dependent alcohol dehydrogenase [Gaiellaceae bacterium]